MSWLGTFRHEEAWATQVLVLFGIVRADACCFNTALKDDSAGSSAMVTLPVISSNRPRTCPTTGYGVMNSAKVYAGSRIYTPGSKMSVPLKIRDVVSSSLRRCETKELPGNTHLLFERQNRV
jgi:hypothetical protein